MKEKKTVEEPEETSDSTTLEKADETEESTSTDTKKRCKAKADETTDTTSDTGEVEKAGYEQNPEQGAAEGAKDSNTLTPGKMTGKPQNVFTPPTSIPGNRMGSGSQPGQEHYSGKSVEPDFQKSPLYVEMSKQIEGMSSAFSKKLDSVEKSVNDRMANIMKLMEKIEEFNKKSFNKAYAENLTQDGNHESVEDIMKKGKARFVE
jgi:hypothetical protein